MDLRLYGRLRDTGGRTYELGYMRQPIYPMDPVYQYTAVYTQLRAASGWHLDVGGLGAAGEWHLGGGYRHGYAAIAARVERASPALLCDSSAGALLYFIPEARLDVPVSARFSVRGLASYRGKLSVRSCAFHPSLLTLDLAAVLALGERWTANGGLGHYGLYDYGAGSPGGEWGSRTGAAETVHLGARYGLGRVAILGEYRYITYAGGTHQLRVAIEFRSSPDGP